jgi:hypothetical protein
MLVKHCRPNILRTQPPKICVCLCGCMCVLGTYLSVWQAGDVNRDLPDHQASLHRHRVHRNCKYIEVCTRGYLSQRVLGHFFKESGTGINVKIIL